MAVRDIIQLGNPILWQKSAPVVDTNSPETVSLVTDLRDTLASFRDLHGYGRGIAAPQIGILKRAIYVRMPSGEFEGPLINPEITREDSTRMERWDTCFSFPDLMVRVSRAVAVEVAFTDENGQPRHIRAVGDFSELLQHEIDHLDGILAVQRAVSPMALATRDEWIRMGRPE